MERALRGVGGELGCGFLGVRAGCVGSSLVEERFAERGSMPYAAGKEGIFGASRAAVLSRGMS